MDGEHGYGATTESPTEGNHVQGKENDLPHRLEGNIILDQRETVIHRESNQPRSSYREFMDLLEGNSLDSDVNVEGTSEHPCYSREGAEDKVQELTLSNYNVILGGTHEGEMVDPIQNQRLLANQSKGHVEPGSSLGDGAQRRTGCTTSSTLKDERRVTFSEYFARKPSDQDPNALAEGEASNDTDAVRRETLPSGGMRMKVISRAGVPEYFVKHTLKGKGMIYRGSNLAASSADHRGQNISKTAGADLMVQNTTRTAGADHRGQNTAKTAGAATISSDPPLNVSEKSVLLSGYGATPPALHGSPNCPMDGVSLRDRLKLGTNKLNKAAGLSLFRLIVDLVDSSHSKGKVLLDLRPSCFEVLPSEEISYRGRFAIQRDTVEGIVSEDASRSEILKRPLDLVILPPFLVCDKRTKICDNVSSFRKPELQLGPGLNCSTANAIDISVAGPGGSGWGSFDRCLLKAGADIQSNTCHSSLCGTAWGQVVVVDEAEERWYKSPEELLGQACNCSSNVYALGILFFELLSCFDSGKAHAAAMSDLHDRILPPKFLSENLKEAGFCLWLLHPNPLVRPTTRDILQSEVVSEFQELCGDDMSISIHQDDTESELLLHFLSSMKDQKEKHACKLVEDVRSIESDIKEVEKRHMSKLSPSHQGQIQMRETSFSQEGTVLRPIPNTVDMRLLRNVGQLESAYSSMRSRIDASDDNNVTRPDRDVLRNRENSLMAHPDEAIQQPHDRIGAFFDGLCKYGRYNNFEVCATLRNGEFSNSANVICSLSFDRYEDYFAAAGVSKKIKIFEFQALHDDSVDIHYPVTEMSNKSRLSCVCWNNYIRNYLASTDYDGIVKLWDACSGQELSQYSQHKKRAWSVDFSQLDPTKFASGSDDCSVKLWSINERNCLHTIRSGANVCCVQFSPHSSHLLAIGSADYKIYAYDLRRPDVPWCVLAGHEKAASYVKFLDPATLVSASTDNTLKVWDLNKSSSVGVSTNACSLTLRGHTNEKNFVGLSVADGYIACGSETNEVYTYYKSLPMPITSHKFGSIDPVSGRETDEDNGQFVSSVCWRGKSNVILAANSSGCIKVLRMV